MAKQFGSQVDLQKIPVVGLVPESGATAPAAPVEGQLWFDSGTLRGKIRESGVWADLTGAGAGGSNPIGPAGGDLSGAYPDPQIAAGVIVDADVNALNKDGLATVPSMRTLGTGATQAAAGDHGHTGYATQAEIDDITIATVPSTSLSTVKSGSTATGDLTYTITLDSLTLANTIPGTAPDPNNPAVPGEPGDLYIDTTLGTTWIYDGTTWTQLDAPSAASGVTAVTGGAGATVDASTPAVPIVNVGAGPGIVANADDVAVLLETTDPGLAVAATGLQVALSATPGLSKTGGLAVLPKPAGGILVDATGVSVDPTVLLFAKKFAGDTAALVVGVETVVTHSLGTADVVASFRDPTTGADIGFAWRVIDANSIGVTADLAYATVRATVVG